MSCPECGGSLIPMVDGSFCLSCEKRIDGHDAPLETVGPKSGTPKDPPRELRMGGVVRPPEKPYIVGSQPSEEFVYCNCPVPPTDPSFEPSETCPIHGENSLIGHDPKFKIDPDVRFQGGVAMSTVEVAEGVLRGSPEFSREEIAEIFGIPPDLLPRNRK